MPGNTWIKGHNIKKNGNPFFGKVRSGRLAPMYGKKFSARHCNRIRKSKIGTSLSEETKVKIGLASKSSEKSKEFIAMIGSFSDVNSRKGIALSEEHRLKISTSMTGVIFSERHKDNISLSISGNKHPNWQGGKSFEEYCRTWTDSEFKAYVLERDEYKCQNPLCNKTCKKLCRHHIDYDKKNCGPSNIITVCVSCNSRANYNRESWQEHYEEIMANR